jgi:hypothetical protein
MTTQSVTGIKPTSNGAEEEQMLLLPFRVAVTVEGVAPILFHAWNNEAVEAKGKAAKGSKAKKTDNLESYIYRTEDGCIGIKGMALRAAMVEVGRYTQDPRSPRKSAMDLLKAAVVPLTVYASTGVKEWDYIDRQRVTVQRAAITRERPALRTGWTATFHMLNTLPEYVSPQMFNRLVADAGRLAGLGDFRPTYGRFQVTHFEVLET